MNRLKLLVVASAILFSYSLKAQIFINTGNPDLEKYKKENPNAVIWDGGKNVPIPPDIPAESKAENPKKETTGLTKKDTPKKEQNRDTESHYSNKPSIQHSQPAKTHHTEPVLNEAEPPVAAKTGQSTHKEPVPDYPPNAIPGRCYARCIVPDQYELVEEQVLDKPASVKVERIPAVYESYYDTVVAVPAGRRIITIPAQYETITEDKMVAPATQKWVRGPANKNCLSPNPKDCEVWCLKDVPPVYQKVSRKVEVVPASVREEEIPAVTRVELRRRIVKPAEEVKTETPASYKTILKKQLVKKGGGYEWKEILCEQEVTESKITAIQQALIREGYDPGPIDNQMGGKTKEALIKFQQDKGLPVGNLNIETLKALGVEH